MKKIAQTVLFVLAISLVGCNRNSSGSANAVPRNLSVVVWSSFPPGTNSYRHFEHLTNLLQQANVLIATNTGIFSQSQTYGRLAEDSPLRKLLNIPTKEPAQVEWSQSMDDRWISVSSSKTHQRFGWIKVNLRSGKIDAAYDVEALFTISEIECRLRQIVGTREEALRLFGGRQDNPPSQEQQQATKAIAEALFLPPDTELFIQMSAGGGSNMGQGMLRIETRSNELIARAFYGIDYSSRNPITSTLNNLGLIPRKYSYRSAALVICPHWTNLNTQRFLLDTNGYPYPQMRAK